MQVINFVSIGWQIFYLMLLRPPSAAKGKDIEEGQPDLQCVQFSFSSDLALPMSPLGNCAVLLGAELDQLVEPEVQAVANRKANGLKSDGLSQTAVI